MSIFAADFTAISMAAHAEPSCTLGIPMPKKQQGGSGWDVISKTYIRRLLDAVFETI